MVQGTVVLPVLECCHKDPKLWENPDQFNPERFLNPDGTFNSRKEGIVPFGTGEWWWWWLPLDVWQVYCSGERLLTLSYCLIGRSERPFSD